jgi:hypothetical protein
MRRGGLALLLAGTATAAGAQVDTATRDGLTIHWDAKGRIVGVRVGRRELPVLGKPGGFVVSVYRPVAEGDTNLLPGGDWETAVGGKPPAGWLLGDRWAIDETGGRGGGKSAVVTNPGNQDGRSGQMASPNVPVHPGERYLLTFWAKVRGVGGTYPPHLYIEQLKDDGSWAQPQIGIPTAFGDHDWWRLAQAVTVQPGTRYLRVYGNIYAGYGMLWVDELRLVRMSDALEGKAIEGVIDRTDRGARVTAHVPDESLELAAEVVEHPDHLRVDATVRSLTEDDRPLECALVLPVDLTGWRWHDDINGFRPVSAEGPCQATGEWGRVAISLYPFCCVEDGNSALSLGSPADVPRVNVVQGQLGRGLLVRYRVGVTPKTTRLPSRASFSAELFSHDPSWGLRGTIAKYYTLHPEEFAERTDAEGCWYLGGDPSIAHPEDFALTFHEIDGGTTTWKQDRGAGILDFKYTEPWGGWIGFRFASPDGGGYQAKSVAEAEELLQRAVNLPDESLMGIEPHAFGTLPLRRWARVIQNCALVAPDGSHYVTFGYGLQNFGLNPDPDLPSPNRWDVSREYEIEEAFRRSREVGAEIPGVYLDSIAPGWAGRVSVRREHFAYAHHPLVYLEDDPQLALLPAFEWVEFCRRLAAELRPRGKVIMANMFPPAHTLFAPYLDMMGAGEGSTANFAATYPYQRTMAYHKPLSILDYDLMKPEIPMGQKEEAMLAGFPYAVFPGTSPFDDPKLYDTMRPLYRRYMPTFLELAHAGWEPITYARVEPRDVLMERYGPHSGGAVYLALRNPTDARVTARIALSRPGFPGKGDEATELLSGTTLRPAGGVYAVELPPKRCAALRFAVP